VGPTSGYLLRENLYDFWLEGVYWAAKEAEKRRRVRIQWWEALKGPPFSNWSLVAVERPLMLARGQLGRRKGRAAWHWPATVELSSRVHSEEERGQNMSRAAKWTLIGSSSLAGRLLGSVLARLAASWPS